MKTYTYSMLYVHDLTSYNKLRLPVILLPCPIFDPAREEPVEQMEQTVTSGKEDRLRAGINGIKTGPGDSFAFERPFDLLPNSTAVNSTRAEVAFNGGGYDVAELDLRVFDSQGLVQKQGCALGRAVE